MHLGRSITYECFLSQSVSILSSLNDIIDDVFKRKCSMNGEVMFHSSFKKDIENGEKVVLLEVKGLSISGLKKFCVCFYHSTSWNMKYQLRKQLCSFENERLISLSYAIWFLISEKKILQGARFFTVVHACIKSLNEAYKKWFLPLSYLYVD